MSQFTLHPQFEADSFFMRDLTLCQLRLHDQQSMPWFILVPKRPNIREIFQLEASDRAQLMEEITQVSKALTAIFTPDKINVGALGNVVEQLHIHVIARFKDDDAWPAPVWGRLMPDNYAPEKVEEIKTKLNAQNW